MYAEVPPNKYGHRGPLPNKSMEAEVPRKGIEAEVPPEEPHQKYGRKDIDTHIQVHTYIYMHIYIYMSMNTEVPQDK